MVPNTNFLELKKEDLMPITSAVSFEVFEHMNASYVKQFLKHAHEITTKNAEFLFSTPVWDPKVGAAKNHLNEMTREAFGYLLEKSGYTIVKNFGTFASIKDYKNKLTEAEKRCFHTNGRIL